MGEPSGDTARQGRNRIDPEVRLTSAATTAQAPLPQAGDQHDATTVNAQYIDNSFFAKDGSAHDAPSIMTQNAHSRRVAIPGSDLSPDSFDTGVCERMVYPMPVFHSPADPVQSGSVDTSELSVHALPFSLGLAILCRSPETQQPLQGVEPEFPIDENLSVILLRSFLSETATWCETTDSSKQFSVIAAHDLIAHPIGRAAAFALACRQIGILDDCFDEAALRLYQYTIQMLIQQDPDQADNLVLAACILLCVYEMMASEVADWRRQLKVCGACYFPSGLPFDI